MSDYIRPRDAATLILVRDNTEVLLGLRSRKHVFMPHRFVFPGGAVDPGDGRVPRPVALREPVQKKLARGCSTHRGHALAMAAVRETWEETGLLLGRESNNPPQSRSPHWRDFYAQGLVPALDVLDYVARAITPPQRVRRFDARFFLADARHAQGELRGNGELEELAFVPLDEVHKLPLASVTAALLERLAPRLRRTSRNTVDDTVPLIRNVRGQHIIEDH